MTAGGLQLYSSVIVRLHLELLICGRALQHMLFSRSVTADRPDDGLTCLSFAEVDDLLLCRRLSVFQSYPGGHLLAESVVRHANHLQHANIPCLSLSTGECSSSSALVLDTPAITVLIYIQPLQGYYNIRFYRATRMHSVDYAVARCLCPSVRLSVCLSHAGNALKQLNIAHLFFHHVVDPPLYQYIGYITFFLWSMKIDLLSVAKR